MNQIKIDLDRVLSDIDRNIFGGYMEGGIYGGIYCPDSPLADKDGLRSDVRNALIRLNHPNIRFPGGNFASGYHWMDGVGPQEKRPAKHDLSWNSTVTNHYGTNEFMILCRKLNIEPYLCVNCGDGDMREAADWVEYCNGTGDTALVKLRREHGFSEPHKIKYWGIGNEVDALFQIGYKTPEEYAREFTEFSKVMKRVDPDIKLVASGLSIWEDNPLPPIFPDPKTEWVERAQLMLEQAGDRIDHIAIHRYAHPRNDDPFETYMAFATDFDERLNAYEGLIRAISLERGIKHHIGIAVDEWGVMRVRSDYSDASRRREKRVVNLEDALITGLYLNAFIRHANSVRMANFTPMMMAMGIGDIIARPESTIVPQTLFYPFELYNRTCGRLALDVFWKGDTFSGKYLNRTYDGIRTLDVAATLDKERKQLVVYVVNQNKDKGMESTVALANGEFDREIQVSVINGPDIKAENTQDKPNQVVTRESSVTVSGKSFTYTFEPHSVTALVCVVS
jgi:alpha-N-arabinofuranosidase